MKSVFLLFAFIASGLSVYGQGDYLPLLKEGKVWQEHISSRPDCKWVHTYSVDGDTLIDGEKYYKLYKQTSLYIIPQMGAEPELETAYDIQYDTALKEDAGRVYTHQNGKASLLYDFNLKPGDVPFESDRTIMSVTKVDSIIVGGRKYKRLWLTETYKSNSQEKYTGYWVEGIGSVYGIKASRGWDAIPISLLDGCYEDGTLIFSAEDFEAPAISGKCATPTIAYVNRRLVFSCETPGAEYVYKIICSDNVSGRGGEVSLSQTYEIRVHATLDGYEDSDVATATIGWRNGRPVMEGFSSVTLGDSEGIGDVNGDGKVDVADIATIIDIMAGQKE